MNKTISPGRGFPQRQPLLATAAMASGAAFIAAIVWKMSLFFVLSLLTLFAGLIVAYKWSRSDARQRQLIKALGVSGFYIGVVATFAYDGVRLLIITLAAF